MRFNSPITSRMPQLLTARIDQLLQQTQVPLKPLPLSRLSPHNELKIDRIRKIKKKRCSSLSFIKLR